jgi:large subunit ribosomal protein L25
MEHINLQVQSRSQTGKGPNRRLRDTGFIPAVIYGKGIESVAVSVEPRMVVDALNGTYGRNTVFDLQVEGSDTTYTVLIRDFQVHPWRRVLEHVDFWAIQADQELLLNVPLAREGHAPLESVGGQVRQTRATVKIRCLPAHIPAAISVDMTALAMDASAFRISELVMPEGVEALYKSDYTIIDVRIPLLIEEVEEEDETEGEEGEGEGGEAGAASAEKTPDSDGNKGGDAA